MPIQVESGFRMMYRLRFEKWELGSLRPHIVLRPNAASQRSYWHQEVGNRCRGDPHFNVEGKTCRAEVQPSAPYGTASLTKVDMFLP